MERFGPKVREARMKKRVPLQFVADELEFSAPHIYDIEKGNRNPPSEEKVRKWAILLDLDADEMITLSRLSRANLELPLKGLPDSKLNLAFMLARAWETLSEEDEADLMSVLGRVGEK